MKKNIFFCATSSRTVKKPTVRVSLSFVFLNFWTVLRFSSIDGKLLRTDKLALKYVQPCFLTNKNPNKKNSYKIIAGRINIKVLQA